MDSPDSIISFRLTAGVAQTRINELAKDTFRVALTFHAKARMAERDILIGDVYRVLRTGICLNDPKPSERGGWECKIVMKLRGGRTVGVVTILLEQKLRIKTVEWEDKV
jgi:hypothetical protein